MATTISAEKYPVFDNGTGISGKRIALYLNYGASATAAAPVWTPIGGVSSHTLTVNGEVATASTKNMGYWSSGSLVSKSAELSADVLMLRNNDGQDAIEEFMLDDTITSAKKALQIAVVDLDTKEGLKLTVIPSSWEITASSDDMVQKSLSATVVGAPEKITGFTVA